MRNYRLILAVGTCFVFAASLVAATDDVVTEPFEGVTVIHSKSMTPRQVDMWVAEIDMRAPGVSFLVTPSNGDLVGDTKPETTRAFVTRVGAQLGVNASFFSLAAKGPDGTLQYNVSGLSSSKGDAYSPFAAGFVDAINISPDNVATIIRGMGKPSKEDLRKLRAYERAVKAAAVKAQAENNKAQASSTNPRAKVDVSKATVKLQRPEMNIGFEHEPAIPLYNALSGKNRLVKDGKNVAEKDPSIHPRTGIGITADGKLLLFTVDGREKDRSLGMKFSEMADAMIRFGARDAISLDGGGSTTFVMDDPATAANDPKVMNLPCDPFPDAKKTGKEHGKERPTGNNLAVFATPKKQAVMAERAATKSTKSHEDGGDGGMKPTAAEASAMPRKSCCCSRRGGWFRCRRR
jgi:phosphodiester glycosidase